MGELALQRENAELQSNNQLLAVRLDSTIAKLAATEADTKRLEQAAIGLLTRIGGISTRYAKQCLDAAKTGVKA